MEKNKLNEKEVFLKVLAKIAAKVTPTAGTESEKPKQTEAQFPEKTFRNSLKKKK